MPSTFICPSRPDQVTNNARKHARKPTQTFAFPQLRTVYLRPLPALTPVFFAPKPCCRSTRGGEGTKFCQAYESEKTKILTQPCVASSVPAKKQASCRNCAAVSITRSPRKSVNVRKPPLLSVRPRKRLATLISASVFIDRCSDFGRCLKSYPRPRLSSESRGLTVYHPA